MTGKRWRQDVQELRPMMAQLADWDSVPLQDPGRIYEPKFDGIRALICIEPGTTSTPGTPADVSVRILSRNGNDKTMQFPEIAAAAALVGQTVARPLVLDGEIVAIDGTGRALGFEALQPRMHLAHARDVTRAAKFQPCRCFVFDLLRDGDEDVRSEGLQQRRQRLSGIVPDGPGVLALSPSTVGDGVALKQRALQDGWEGLVTKTLSSKYETGARSAAWLKLKLLYEQEFVVGGFTEPRAGRVGLGALLVGTYEDGVLVFAGGVGSGFDDRTLDALTLLLQQQEIAACPFGDKPSTREPAHWVQPSLCVRVKFTEWTGAGNIRHPVFLGILDDRDPRDVHRERTTKPAGTTVEPAAPSARATRSKPATAVPFQPIEPAWPTPDATLGALESVLQDLEDRQQGGRIRLVGGHTLEVSNLHKTFWPAHKLTKGDLLRHYVRSSPYILPVVRDRPLVMKRFPDGVDGEAFYQHRAPEAVHAGARVASLPDDDVPSRFIGGDLFTLLYMAQLGSISQDPWFSRVQSPMLCDEVALDLDPMDGVPFSAVNDCARWIRDLLGKYGFAGFPKTSGATGLHIYLPLKPGTPYEAGRLFAQILATMIARKHPEITTVERKVDARGQTVYIDYLQNIHGKTLACAYSARASAFAGVSAPLTWEEIDAGVDPRAFTLETMPARLAAVGDLWAGTREPKNQIDLATALARLQGG